MGVLRIAQSFFDPSNQPIENLRTPKSPHCLRQHNER
jgi:hypothetical protein